MIESMPKYTPATGIGTKVGNWTYTGKGQYGWEEEKKPIEIGGFIVKDVKERIEIPPLSSYISPSTFQAQQLGGIQTTTPKITEEKGLARLPFGLEKREIPGGLGIAMPIEFTSRLIEIIPKTIAFTIANYKSAQETIAGKIPTPIELPIDARRLGFEEKTIQDVGSQMINDFNKLEDENPGHPIKNGVIAIFNGPISQVLDIWAGEAILKSLAFAGLKVTGYDPELNFALNRLRLKPNEVNSNSVKDAFIREFEQLTKNIGKTIPLKKQFNDLGRSVATISDRFFNKGIPQMNKLGEIIQDTSKTLLGDIKNVRKIPIGLSIEDISKNLPAIRKEAESIVADLAKKGGDLKIAENLVKEIGKSTSIETANQLLGQLRDLVAKEGLLPKKIAPKPAEKPKEVITPIPEEKAPPEAGEVAKPPIVEAGKPKILPEVAPKVSTRQAISDEYVGGYKKYLEELKKIDSEPVSFEEWAKFHSMSALRREAPTIAPEAQKGVAPALKAEKGIIPLSELKLVKNVKEEGMYRNFVVDKTTGKRLVETTTSPAWEKDIMKNGLDKSLVHYPENLPIKDVIPPEIIKRPPTAEKILGIEKPPLITRREDVLLRKRIRDEARGARIGAIESKRLTKDELITKFKSSQAEIKEIQKDLMKYIEDNLPQEAKGKFANALIQDNLTRKKAASIFSRVERMKETLTRKELVGEIKKLSVPKGNLAIDYQKQITEVVEGIDLVKPTEATLKKLKGLRDYIQREGIPLNIQSKHLERLVRLTKKSASELSTAELTELEDTLNQLHKLGKLKQELKYKYNERERKVALDRLLASTQNIDPKVSGKQTKLDTYKVGTKKVYMDTLHTPRVADMIDGFKGYQGENAKLIKALGQKETEAKKTVRATVNSALEEIQNLGIEELTEEQQIRMMINIRHREGAFDQVKTLMEKNELKEIPKLTDQENKVIEIIKKYTNENTDDIATVFEEIENQPFHKLKEYILPIKYEKEFNLIPSQTIEQGRFRTTQTFKGFTFERQKGVEKVPRTDILAIFEETINEQQWYLKMQPELENIKYLVKSEEYLAKGGEMASNWWRNELDIVARRGWSATARSNPVLRQGRINLTQAILGYKISSILMQPFAIFDAMAYAQSRYGTMAALEVLLEFSKAWIIPKYAKNIIAESPALQQRQAGELAIEETLKKVGRAKGLVNSFIRGGMSLLQKADVITAAGVEKGLMNVMEKYGIPNAKEESEFLMNMVSGSNEVVYRPHILASGEGARTWFTFQTFFLNRWGIMIHDLIKSGVIKGGRETGWKGLWKRISALIGLGIFIAGSIAENEARKVIYETTTGKKLPDESALKTATMFIPEQIPYFGNLIEAADRGGDANPPVIRVVENIFSGGASLIKGTKPETKIKGALRMTEAGITLGAGVPGTAQFFDLMENIFLGEKKKSAGGLPSLPKLPQLPKLPKLPKI